MLPGGRFGGRRTIRSVILPWRIPSCMQSYRRLHTERGFNSPTSNDRKAFDIARESLGLVKRMERYARAICATSNILNALGLPRTLHALRLGHCLVHITHGVPAAVARFRDYREHAILTGLVVVNRARDASQGTRLRQQRCRTMCAQHTHNEVKRTLHATWRRRWRPRFKRQQAVQDSVRELELDSVLSTIYQANSNEC